MIKVDGHVCIEGDLEVSNFIVVDVVFIDLFGNDEESHIILLLQHDLHLVKNELKLFTLIHGSIGLHLHLLQNACCLQNIIFVLFVLHNHQHTSCVFHFKEDLFSANVANGLN